MNESHYAWLAAAYVRGSLGVLQPRLEELSEADCEALVQQGQQAGLRLHRFKRTSGLPRVRKVLGWLKGLQPPRLLDLGTGRGAFLWPLLDEFPYLEVTCLDRLDYRVADLNTVARGGVTRLSALQGELHALPFGEREFPLVTLLEVLEHTPDPQRCLAEVARVTDQSLILSVPSRPDDNPEHLHVLPPEQLQAWLLPLGFQRFKAEAVLNHWVMLAQRDVKLTNR